MSEIAHDPADETAMRLALDQARNAWLIGEVPVGAVVMRGAQVIATGYNRATSAACLERSLSMTRSTHRDSVDRRPIARDLHPLEVGNYRIEIGRAHV